MIKEIELRNWRTHGHTKMSFQKGVNVLVGIMGSGKSSVMEAISFALFGTFPMVKQRRAKLEGMIKNRPVQESEAEVRLTFEVGKDEYTVTRRITGAGSTTARLDKNGAHLQSQPVRVNEEIASVLKVDYDTFARAIYAEQNGLEYFLDIAKGDRKKQIDGMLGLDQFATAEENCTTLINNIKAATSGEESILAGMDVASLTKQLERAASEKEAALKEISDLKRSEASIKADLERINELMAKQRQMYKRKEELLKKAAELSGRVQLLKEELEKINAKTKSLMESAVYNAMVQQLAKEKESKEEIESAEKMVRSIMKEVAGLQASIKNDERRLAEKIKVEAQAKLGSVPSLEKELALETESLNALINSAALGRSRFSDIDASLKELRKHLAKCPICERELGAELSERLIAAKQAEADALQKGIVQSDTLIEQKRAAVKRIGEEIAVLSRANSRLEEYAGVEEALLRNREHFARLSKDLEESARMLEDRKLELEKLKEKTQDTRAMLELYKKKAEYETEMVNCSKLAENNRRESESITVSQSDLDSMQSSLTERSAALAKATATITGAEKQVAGLDANIASLVKQIDSIKELQQRIERRRSVLKNLNIFKTSLVDTEAFLRGRLTQSINSLMQGIWPDLYPYADYQRLRLSAKPDDYLLEVDVQSNGASDWVQVDAVASGGERSIACLAMRIALSMVVVPNLRWLILDEPTHNIDASGISKLISVLGDTLPNVVEQVFIITHDDNLKQITSAKVYQLERDKGSAGSTTVSEL
ncbi:MAG: SMC family ATPase [Candidatus Marsarchaeota archaeon]|jgi:exonuclease SbcC|nr:SMC family ATPase [Candidatus Marsarchaeota archaeon]MCL5111609.1 SMC family ATPase [Candidatus Marsarchaeota archaeon]